MGRAHDRNRLEVLDEPECRRLLTGAVIGRLAYTEGALPAIRPVHFAMSGDRIVIPAQVGSTVAVACRNAVVAFEADDFDAVARTGWTVTVVGQSQVVSRPAEVAALDALGARSWAPAGTRCYIVIEAVVVRGRRITPGAVPAVPTLTSV